MTRQEVPNASSRNRALIVRVARGMPATVMIDDAAALLGVSRRTVYYRIREGRLRTVRTLCGTQRVLVASIAELMREDRPEVTGRGADASGTAPSGKFPTT